MCVNDAGSCKCGLAWPTPRNRIRERLALVCESLFCPATTPLRSTAEYGTEAWACGKTVCRIYRLCHRDPLTSRIDSNIKRGL